MVASPSFRFSPVLAGIGLLIHAGCSLAASGIAGAEGGGGAPGAPDAAVAPDAAGARDASDTPDAPWVASCADGMRDGAETGVDCGGGACPPCALGDGCATSDDCASGFCNAGTCGPTPTCGQGFPSGKFTLLTEAAAAGLDSDRVKQYLYLGPNYHWYLSPPTKEAWRWTSGIPLAGAYTYCDGVKVQSYTCGGSGELPQFGVGCSSGPGPKAKTLPYYEKNPPLGQGTICQDIPNAFAGLVCQKGVSIYFRHVPAP